PTILSRCQIFDFNRIKVADMADHLASIAAKEGVSYDRDGLHIIAQKADGGLRDALSMFDQIVSFSNKEVSYQAVIDNLNILDYEYYFRLTDAVIREDSASALLLLDEILAHGFDGSHYQWVGFTFPRFAGSQGSGYTETVGYERYHPRTLPEPVAAGIIGVVTFSAQYRQSLRGQLP